VFAYDLPLGMEPVSIVREVTAKCAPVPLEPRTDTPVNCVAGGYWKYAAAVRALERELFSPLAVPPGTVSFLDVWDIKTSSVSTVQT